MDVFAVDRFIALVERLIGLSWPIKVDQFEPMARQLGWSPANVSGFFTGNFASEEQSIMLNEDEVKNITVVSLPFFRPEGEEIEKIGLLAPSPYRQLVWQRRFVRQLPYLLAYQSLLE